MQPPLRKPALYCESGSPAFPQAPALRGIECRCGYHAFPPQHLGCEVCGAHGEALRDTLLSGRGRLLACARVHRHGTPWPPVPFTVVEVQLDDGPVVRGLLAQDCPADLAPGTRMVTVLETVQIDGTPMRDLRLRPEGH